MRIRGLVAVMVALLGSVIGAGAAADGVAAGWERLLLDHAARHPRWEAQDCYKLLVQATLGAEHAAPSEAAALAWMEKEVAALGAGAGEELLEPIRPDGALVRVNLRPFLARGGDWRALARAFAATGRRPFGTRADLTERWAHVVSLARGGRLHFTAEEARSLGEKMQAAGWPAVHHSARYGGEYRPAYRVVAREELAALGLGDQ